ncbi:MAG: anthranilate phosphoribosyltransferase [Sporolactobacillus sp.]
MFQDILARLANHQTLSEAEAAAAMDEIMEGKAGESQITAFLAMLSLRGESADELTGCARSMRAHARQLRVDRPLLDIVGTGGDGTATFNISTASALVISSLGVDVAKHGNRSVSSTSGAADVLEALSISIQSTPEDAHRLLDMTHMCFLFAPLYHQSMKYAIGPRKALGFRTIFNMLGPLTNPAGAERQMLGVYSQELAELYAHALVRLGTERTLVVTGDDGMDELTIAGRSHILLIENEKITASTLTPEDVGLHRGTLKAIQVANPAQSAALIESIFTGSTAHPEARDAILLNAGAGLFTAGFSATIGEGVHEAREALDSGRAIAQLNALRRASKETIRAHA